MARKQSTRSTPSRGSKGGIRALERSLRVLEKTQEDLGKMQEALEELHGMMSEGSEEPRSEGGSGPRRGTTSSKRGGANTGRRGSQGATGRKTEGRNRGKGTRAARSGRQSTDRLSRSTKYAKWIESPDDHEDHPGQSLVTRHHDVIRRWAEEREARPATVEATEHDGRPGVLTFDFPGYGGENLKPISWDEWLQRFDERNLVFHFQEHKKDGSLSNFFRLDSPDREDA
jgi:hypothetical protein